MSPPFASLAQTSGEILRGSRCRWGRLRRGSAGPGERRRRDHARGHTQEVRAQEWRALLTKRVLPREGSSEGRVESQQPVPRNRNRISRLIHPLAALLSATVSRSAPPELAPPWATQPVPDQRPGKTSYRR